MKRAVWLLVGMLLGAIIGQPALTPLMAADPNGNNSLNRVSVSGTVTVGNCVQWLNATTVQDAGKTC